MSDKTKSLVYELAKKGKAASKIIAASSASQKNEALSMAADLLRSHTDTILEANHRDVSLAAQRGRNDAFLDRLMLDSARINSIAQAVENISGLSDPVGRELAVFERENGLKIRRVAVPIGVIGMVFEARPNVAADAGALCLKSGNAVILRSGSESIGSASVIVRCLREALEACRLPADAIQIISTTERTAVNHLLKCRDYIDLIIPRGGKGLVQLVVDEATIPTLQHLDGNCHTYIHCKADISKAETVVRNAKLRRTGICGATESLVIDESIAPVVLPRLIDGMPECEFRGDAGAKKIDSRVRPAVLEDWATEYLDAVLSVKLVPSLEEAITFVDRYSSKHTDAIITEDDRVADVFMTAIDSAVVMHNASTQFSDGGEFGMGAEIGIATGKIHARGPVGLEQLTTFKYKVHGEGQVRP